MKLFTRSLWPSHIVAPYRRLLTAFVVSPILLALILSVLTLIPARMIEPTASAVVAVTIDTSVGLTMLMVAFAATIGLAGVAILWAFAQRGLMVWLLTGLLGGTAGGLIMRAALLNGLPDELMISCALVGVVFFALVRMIAGIQDEPRPS